MNAIPVPLEFMGFISTGYKSSAFYSLIFCKIYRHKVRAIGTMVPLPTVFRRSLYLLYFSVSDRVRELDQLGMHACIFSDTAKVR